ncbi:hypothetical protein MmarC5_1278 [Methanococcus maripaludis C5]|uniref:Uncharacterized protein n=1 Tax=Methanococcus maripaludis (strain C5 / ATCC BAA-1333) TaxID=402880 RepID=A4FZE2_METM5|nr:hypothetical protein [Methanococcus maripaludis]ABO35576.1 hypothetical protein MmarC5_1278 [Methanococcus maripaludis C5]
METINSIKRKNIPFFLVYIIVGYICGIFLKTSVIEYICFFIIGICLLGFFSWLEYRKYRKDNDLVFSEVRVTYSDGTSEELSLFDEDDNSIMVDKIVLAYRNGLTVENVEVIE